MLSRTLPISFQATFPVKQKQPLRFGSSQPRQADILTLRFGQAENFEAKTRKMADEIAKPLEETDLAYKLAHWNFNLHGGQELSGKVQEAMAANIKTHNNPAAYERLKSRMATSEFKNSNDPVLKKYLEILTQAVKPDPPEIEALIQEQQKMASTLQEAYGHFMAEPEGFALSLYTPESSNKTYGEMLRDLAKSRNAGVALLKKYDDNADVQNAKNFYELRLKKDKIDPVMLGNLMQQLKTAVKGYGEAIQSIRKHPGVNNYRTKIAEWDNHVESAIKQQGVKNIIEKTAKLVGLPVGQILDKSDLYKDPKRPGKLKHWATLGINAPHDVRILANIPENTQELEIHHIKGQALHEIFMHGICDFQSMDSGLPYFLRRNANTLTAEALAEMGESLVFNETWLNQVLDIPKEVIANYQPYIKYKQMKDLVEMLQHLIASYNVEKAMYENPDQDLGKIYLQALQDLNPSDVRFVDDQALSWADTIHFVSHPVYLQNYILGRAIGAQMQNTLDKDYEGFPSPKAGEHIRKCRSTGLLYDWPEQLQRMTGKPLSTDALIHQLDDLKKAAMQPLSEVKQS